MKKNKILIVADLNNEPAKLIKQWLVSLNIDFLSIDTERDIFKIGTLNVETNSFSFFVNNQEYFSSEFDSIYFHRGALMLSDRLGIRANREKFNDIKNAFHYYMTGYENTVKELTNITLGRLKTYGSDNGGRVNKIEMLISARNSGFSIPNTIVTTKKSDLIDFANSASTIITKSLDSNLTFLDSDRNLMIHNLTSSVTNIDELPETFPLSIFQENIPKFIELRVFYIDDNVYASAIFSQNTQNTVQDYRNYDSEIPNRVIPFKLPKTILSKLKKFRLKTGLKTGSIDLLLTESGKYYFLEVNPQGQFIGVSNYCNYKLEKVVAQTLIN